MAVTMERLVEVRDCLQSLQDAHDEAAMVALLQPLQGSHLRLSDLAASKVAVVLGRLAREAAGEAGAQARTLLKSWKELAKAEGVVRPRRDSVSALEPRRYHPYGAAPHLRLGRLHCEQELRLYAEQGRNAMVRRLADALSLPVGAAPKDLHIPLLLAIDIERELHAMLEDHHGMETKLIKFHQLVSNLHENAGLRRAVLSGEIPARHLPHMHAWELGKLEARQAAHLKAQQDAIEDEPEVVSGGLGLPDLSRQ